MGGRLSFMRVVAAALALSLLCSFVLSAAPVKKITVNIEGKPLKEALETIKIASGYSFFYSDALDDSFQLRGVEIHTGKLLDRF